MSLLIPPSGTATIVAEAVVEVEVLDGEAEFDAEVFVDGVIEGSEVDGGAGFGFEAAGFFKGGEFTLEDEFEFFAGMGFAPFAMGAVDAGFVEGEFFAVNADSIEETVAALVSGEGVKFGDFCAGVLGMLLSEIRNFKVEFGR